MIRKPKGITARLRAAKKRNQRKADKAVYARIAEDSGGCCAECGRFGIQMHHVVMRSRGGKTTIENVRPLCVDCHAKAHRLR